MPCLATQSSDSAVSSSEVPGRKEMGEREKRSRSLNRKPASGEKLVSVRAHPCTAMACAVSLRDSIRLRHSEKKEFSPSCLATQYESTVSIENYS